MGQEPTARTKYRGLVKRQLVPLAFTGPAPAPGTPVTTNGQEAGNLRSCAGRLALAMLRLNALEKVLDAGDTVLRPRVPAWMRGVDGAAPGH